MCPATAPDDTWLAGSDGLAELKGRAAVVCPRQLEDSLGALDGLDAQAGTESRSPEIVDELLDGLLERGALLRRKSLVVPPEAGKRLEGRQAALPRPESGEECLDAVEALTRAGLELLGGFSTLDRVALEQPLRDQELLDLVELGRDLAVHGEQVYGVSTRPTETTSPSAPGTRRAP